VTDVRAIQLDGEHNEEEELEDDNGLLGMEAFGQVGEDDTSLYIDNNDADYDSDDGDLNAKVDYKAIAEGRKLSKEWPDIEADLPKRFLDWPQENVDYFKRYTQDLVDIGKMYVQVDKFPLSMLYELSKLLPVGSQQLIEFVDQEDCSKKMSLVEIVL
jgi:hypothetical protein